MGLKEDLSGNTGTQAGIANNDNNDYGVASEFVASDTYTLVKVDVSLKDFVGSPVGDLVCEVYSESSSLPSALLGTATNTVDLSTLTSSYAYYTFNFVGVSIVNGTRYFVVLRKDDNSYDGSHLCAWQGATSVAGVDLAWNSGSGWVQSVADYQSDMKIYDGDDSVTLTSPNGGEAWRVGDSESITWTSSGSVSNVKLEYSIDNGGNYEDIVTSTSDDGGYDWVVPVEDSSTCLVRISDASAPAVNDVSDAVFSIIPLPSQVVGGSSFPIQSWLKLALLLENGFKGVVEWSNRMIADFGFMAPHVQITGDFGARVVRVHDGDTITLRTGFRNFDFPLRIADIDAPELSEGGKLAGDWLRDRVLGKQVVVGVNPLNRVGKYGRLIGSVFCEGFNVGEEMVRAGLVARFGSKNLFEVPSFDKLMKKHEVPSF